MFNFWYTNFCCLKFFFQSKKRELKLMLFVFSMSTLVFFRQSLFCEKFWHWYVQIAIIVISIELKVSILDIGYKIVYRFNTGFNSFLKKNIKYWCLLYQATDIFMHILCIFTFLHFSQMHRNPQSVISILRTFSSTLCKMWR